MDIIPIAECDEYLNQMRLSFYDKADFISRLSSEVTIIIDFGCADASFLHFLKDSYPSYTYYGIENNDKFITKAYETYGDDIKIYKTLQELYEQEDINFSKAHLNMSSVVHELFAYDERPKTTISKIFSVYEFFSISIRDMTLYRKPFVIAAENTNSSSRYATDNLLDMSKVSNIYKLNWLNGLKNISIKIMEQCISDDIMRDKITNFIVCNKKEFNSSQMIMEFLLKYFYTTNWDRECIETYFIDNTDFYDITSVASSYDYKLIYQENYNLPFLINKWINDFSFNNNDVNIINMLTTHVKCFYQKIVSTKVSDNQDPASIDRSNIKKNIQSIQIVSSAPICSIDYEELDNTQCSVCEAPEHDEPFSETNSSTQNQRDYVSDRWIYNNRSSYYDQSPIPMDTTTRSIDGILDRLTNRISAITNQNRDIISTGLRRQRLRNRHTEGYDPSSADHMLREDRSIGLRRL